MEQNEGYSVMAAYICLFALLCLSVMNITLYNYVVIHKATVTGTLVEKLGM